MIITNKSGKYIITIDPLDGSQNLNVGRVVKLAKQAMRPTARALKVGVLITFVSVVLFVIHIRGWVCPELVTCVPAQMMLL